MLLLLVGALLVVALLLTRSNEKVQPEFIDTSQVRKTISVENSSYAQTTNHMDSAPYSTEPIQGMETPFQVNQYTSYVT
jgi:hypothetical protein